MSTFTGAGGSCLGFRWAGFKTVYAMEFVPAARETYAANHGFEPDPRDVREVTGVSIRAMASKRGLRKDQEIDVLEGSPPCASFSTSGARAKHWGEVRKYSDTKQRTDDLFTEFARLVGELRPKVFIAENVSGLLHGVARGYFNEIHAQLAAQGYVVKAKLLDAQWLGVPQARQRVIFMGVREDLGVEPIFPKPLPYRYSIRDALPHLSGTAISDEGFGQPRGSRLRRRLSLDLSAPTIIAEENQQDVQVITRKHARQPRQRLDLDGPLPTVTTEADDKRLLVRGGRAPGEPGLSGMVDPETGYRVSMDGHAIAREYKRLRPGTASDRYFNLIRPAADEPVPTIVASNMRRGVAGVGHPSEPRKFTISELRRLCSFPDDYVLTGTYSQRWERLGQSVPPLMAYHIAMAIRQTLDQADGR